MSQDQLTGPTTDPEFDFETELGPDDFSVARISQLDQLYEAQSGHSIRTAIIRTSDRIAYRRCRRMWNWTFSARGNRQSSSAYAPFWFGSGMHFALEDFHGPRSYTLAREAFKAYARATQKTGAPIPTDVRELTELGYGMLDYYEAWLETREPLNTLQIDGEPQVEVNFHIEIPKEHLEPFTLPHVLDLYDRIVYSVTIDRVTIDSYGRLWIFEYKSAKRFEHMHLDTDPQVSAYCWAAHHKYAPLGLEIAGVCYQQHKKQILQPPAFLSSTRKFSTSKRQKTSHALYIGALRGLYGQQLINVPEDNRLFLEYLKEKETGDSDELIRRDYVERNPQQRTNEYTKILQEVGEMLNPEIPLYPNPTRDCGWQCAFTGPCVAVDAGEDHEQLLRDTTMSRSAPETNWRKLL